MVGWMQEMVQRLFDAVARVSGMLGAAGRRLFRWSTVVLLVLGSVAYAAYRNSPMQTVGPGEIGLRSDVFGTVREFHPGPVLVIPGVHALRRISLRDRVYRPASGEAAYQSVEGLSLAVDLTIRYALDPARIGAIAAQLPEDLDREIVEPAVQGVIYKALAQYTVKEIFSTRRGQIQQAIETELSPRLARDGVVLKGVQMGKVELPSDYRAGMERLLAEELENQKMQYTLALKDQQVKQSELEALAEKVRREKQAEAAGNEQIIAAKAQAEAMKHVLPFKEKQIKQRQLEAEAEKRARIMTAEGNAEARRVEAGGEADSRRKLADAETYRLENLGRVTSAQMERDGQLLSKHPLLIQKTMADKLSDKVQVIIAAPPASGGFIGSSLLGQSSSSTTAYAESE